MKGMIKIFAAILLALPSLLMASRMESVDCLGGEGPTPMIDLTSELAPGVSLLPTGEGVQDFIVLDKSNKVVFRNANKVIRELSLDSMNLRSLSTSSQPLSPVLDSSERYLTLKKRASVLDTKSQPMSWTHYPSSFDLQHLYWERQYGHDVLYSLETVFVTPDQQQIKLYSFVNGQSRPYECHLPSKKGEIYHIGQGHEFPNIFLYKVRKDGDGSWLTSYNVRISGMLGNNQCRMWVVKPYQNKIPGNVLAMHRFPALESGSNEMFVVETDHPTKNFLWDDGPNDCRYFNFSGRKPFVLNHKQPIIATSEESEGLTLIYPRKKVNGEPVILRPLDSVSVAAMDASQLWLSDDGTKLYAAEQAPACGYHGEKMLFSVDLKKTQAFRGDSLELPRK